MRQLAICCDLYILLGLRRTTKSNHSRVSHTSVTCRPAARAWCAVDMNPLQLSPLCRAQRGPSASGDHVMSRGDSIKGSEGSTSLCPVTGRRAFSQQSLNIYRWLRFILNSCKSLLAFKPNSHLRGGFFSQPEIPDQLEFKIFRCQIHTESK